MEKLPGDLVRPGDGGKAAAGEKVRRKVLSPLRCLTVIDIVRLEAQIIV